MGLFRDVQEVPGIRESKAIMSRTWEQCIDCPDDRVYALNPSFMESFGFKKHPWISNLREYARTLEDASLLPHGLVAQYMLFLESAIQDNKESDIHRLNSEIQRMGGPCFECCNMYRKCIEYTNTSSERTQ